MIEWVREDEFGNVVARGIVGQDDPYEEACEEEKAPEPDEPKSGATVNRCEMDAYVFSYILWWGCIIPLCFGRVLCVLLPTVLYRMAVLASSFLKIHF